MNTTTQTSHRADRLGRALLSLEGLSVGDAFGGKFFIPLGTERAVPLPIWRYPVVTGIGPWCGAGQVGDDSSRDAEISRDYVGSPQ